MMYVCVFICMYMYELGVVYVHVCVCTCMCAFVHGVELSEVTHPSSLLFSEALSLKKIPSPSP